jgi:hypothetical protein
VVSQDEGELWYRILGHIHHGVENHATNIYWTSNGNIFSVRLVKGLHHGEVCKVHLS